MTSNWCDCASAESVSVTPSINSTGCASISRPSSISVTRACGPRFSILARNNYERT